MTTRDEYLEVAEATARIVDRIEITAWDGPGLGAWDLRALVGHTSRSLVTVLSYLDRPRPAVTIASPEDYYALIATAVPGGADAVVQRGRDAGQALGADPAAAFHELVDRVRARLADTRDEDAIETIAGGMRLDGYLSTRVFELVVHSLDIAGVTGIAAELPGRAVAETCALAGRIAATQGNGVTVLLALTGRTPLPSEFTIV